MAIFMPLEQKIELCEAKVTLNGEPAKVSGYKNDFATITQIKSGLSAEWSWQTVEHIIKNKGGQFKS